MTFLYCSKCEKSIYIDDARLGRVMSRDKDNCGSVEALCPKCFLMVGKITIIDIEKERPNAPKNYKHEFKEWKRKK